MTDKTLFEADMIKVDVQVYQDCDTHPTDSECYSAADLAAWEANAWSYVGLVVTVRLNHAPIAEDSLWGVESGSLADRTVDPLEWTVPAYLDTAAITMGSSLNEVVLSALSKAREWTTAVNAPVNWGPALRWADPNGTRG